MTELTDGVASRILYLEDDDDVRELLADWLRDSGYDVTALGSTEDALAALRGPVRYELLLSDFCLPNHNADWLLASARAEGRLERTPVIILTSESDPPGIDDVQFLRKPIDVGVLLAHIARAIEPALEPAVPQPLAGEPLISLRLYVSSSVESLKAERHLRKLLQTLDAHSDRRLHEFVRLVVFDVTSASGAVLDAIEADRVIVTPTLVRHAPGPHASFLGDLSRHGVVESMLRDALELTRAPSRGAPAQQSREPVGS